MTNKTVTMPLELAERLISDSCDAEGAGEVVVQRPDWEELRALLDKQARHHGDFWSWLDSAYRDGSEGEQPKFTKYNMEVAYQAGLTAAPAVERQEPVEALLLSDCVEHLHKVYGGGYFGTDVVMLYTSPPAPVAVIYQTQYLGDGGGGWCDVEREEFERDSKHPSYRTRTVACLDKVKELNQ